MAFSLGTWRAAVTTGASNMALQYNYQSVAAVMLVWDKVYGTVPDWAEASLMSSVYAGSIAGMLTLGYLGDVIGRHAAMTVTLSLMAFGALGTALLSWGPFDTMAALIIFWRFVLGVGIGGVYPLSAATSFEDGGDAVQKEAVVSSKYGSPQIGGGGRSVVASTVFHSPSTSFSQVAKKRRVRVAWTSFWQQPGQMLPYLFALLLLGIFQHNHLSLQFRLILGCGALLPAVLAVESISSAGGKQQPIALTKTFPYFTLNRSNDTQGTASSSSSSSSSSDCDGATGMLSQFTSLLADPAINKQLVGCMVCWFCYDVYAYGIVLYTPEILKIIFGSSDNTPEDYWQNVMCVAATFPAALGSVWVLGRWPTRTLQLFGFTGATFGFLLLASLWSVLERKSKTGLFVVFLVQKNLTQFGCGTTSMILPNELFPQKVRSSCNGLAAAAGKVGAFVGSFVFPYVYDGLSIQAVFYGCAAVAGLGALATTLLIPRQMGDPDAQAARSQPKEEAGGGQAASGGSVGGVGGNGRVESRHGDSNGAWRSGGCGGDGEAETTERTSLLSL